MPEITRGSVRRVTRRRRLHPLLCLSAILAVTGLSGCSSIEVVDPAEAGSAACRAAAAHWPDTVGGQSRHATSSSSAGVRAWGDPAIIARCGLTPIGPTTDQCLKVSGVDWVAHQLTDGVRFTTYGRSPAIEVLVPSDYKPEPFLLPAFSAAALEIPQGARHCQ